MFGPRTLARALGNVRDRVLEGPIADLRRMPRVAIDTGPSDTDAWSVGRAHGLARAGQVSTYRYAVHPTARLRGAPVLLVSPLGACGVAFDLRRGCSLVEHLVGEGRHVHQVDDEDVVGHDAPSPGSPADLARWVDDILPHVVRLVSAHHDGAPVHVVGWSLGGLACVLAAAADPTLPIASLTALATPFTLEPVPEHVPSRPLAVAAGGPVLATVQTLLGLVPTVPPIPQFLSVGAVGAFLTTPLTVASHLADRDFLAQLEAIDDLRALVGAQAELVGATFHAMVGPGELERGSVTVGGRRVDLAELRRPVLLVSGEDDVVVPPRAVRAGSAVLSGADTSLMTAPGGHLGVVCGRASRDRLWPALCAFLDRHDPPAEIEPDRRTSRRARRAVRRPLPAAHPRTPDPEAAEESAPAASPDRSGDAPRPSAGRRGRPAPKPATRTRGREG
ncbi:alpha/beta fold hydrolase [Actinomycetospora sp. TBRC 11914]|uniref:alpha/beta fold hydrolase n=1 Tax=Actinomycetospora sp. TBRC 11914 TaxID=2729387 RepID=UPI00145D7CF9|nr:alpha/beta fold hydrolase [Actinomycetospora sp. TBRC 11914]NMO91927.1 alpha/beta hydrolase [Actinomycetospora sp. TBRC 11914]